MDAMRAMLDDLMGKDRNVPVTQRSNTRTRFDDAAVCKYALGGLCPHGLFKNTRSDLGPCPYELHEDNLAWEGVKEDYDQQDSREHERYERRLMKLLEDLIREMDRKIAKCKERAEAESNQKPLRPEEVQRLAEIQVKAKDLLRKSQEAGEQGDVDVSMALAQQAEDLQGQHDRLKRSLTAPDRTMMVCDICGVFINSTDNDQRRQEHLTGKQYLGWKIIREKYGELQRKYELGGLGAAPREPAAADDRERERDRDRPRSSSRPLDDTRSGSRGDRDRERERERSPRRDRGSDYDRRGGEYDRRRDDYDSRRDRDRDYAPRRDDRGYGGGDDYRSRGREVAPPRDLYGGGGSGGGYRERDRYAEDRDRDRRRY